MRIVTRAHLQNWADQFDSKGYLSVLISRLVRATTPLSTKIDFASGNATFVGGWDGTVLCQTETSYTPLGISLWELGTDNSPKSKADKEYTKRSQDSLGYDKQECTFIFVTPRFWRDKNKWIKSKLAEGVWKDIKVYDSSALEQWLDLTPAIARWFSQFIGGYPFDGIQTADEFWEEWCDGPKGRLQPQSITSGRAYEQKQILDFLTGPAGIRAIRASTKNEAVAFVVATAKLFSQDESERFFAKSLIIDSEGNFRGVKINTVTALNLIPRFDETQPLYSAISKGHHVLVPLGADDTFNQETINLPTIDREGQISSLINMGIDRDEAEKFSRESGRNITILKKFLGVPQRNAKWLQTENVREIIPALLIGRWNEKFKGDIDTIEKISNQPYSEYLKILNRWLELDESPIIKIGESWRLISPLDLWTTISPQLTKQDFEVLRSQFVSVLSSGNPFVEPENSNDLFAAFNKQRMHSTWIREGLTQSLILVACYGDNLKLTQSNSQTWVDNIIGPLLDNASEDTWISFDHELPLIAEASPTSFLAAIFNSLKSSQPKILAMFKEEADILSSRSHHTGLLWALEGLAWEKEYLKQVSLILLALSRLDPGGSLSNRPSNSISEIFKTWHYQTTATFDERKDVLKYVATKEPDQAWRLLLRMLPDSHGVAHPTHKMRWRMFNLNTNLNYTYQEIWDTHTFVVSLLIEIFDNSEEKFSQLISESVNLIQEDRNTILDWANSVYPSVHQRQFSTWHAIREILNRHRSHPATSWALPESTLKMYEDLYLKIQPTETLTQLLWLFDEHWPKFPEGFVRIRGDDFRQQQEEVNKARENAVSVIVNDYGIGKVLEIAATVKQPWALGNSLARVTREESDILLVSEDLKADKNRLDFALGFFSHKQVELGLDWIKFHSAKLSKIGFDNRSLANLYLTAEQNLELWQYLEVLPKPLVDSYWSKIYPQFFAANAVEREFGLRKLLSVNRFMSAIDVASHSPHDIPTDLLIEILYRAATEKGIENTQFKGYEIERIFEALDKMILEPTPAMINLEWLYMPILSSYGSNRPPKILHDELARSPSFFIEVLSWTYRPKSRNSEEQRNDDLSDKEKQNRAHVASQLLHSWKTIPGTESDGTLNKVSLVNWINEVRDLSAGVDRADVADMHIGRVLAQYPETSPRWPNEDILNTIESINSEALNRNYGAAMFNKRGSSTRGAFDGGDIEREHAKDFDRLYEYSKMRFPTVAKIFQNMAEGYRSQAKLMDQEAERDKLEF